MFKLNTQKPINYTVKISVLFIILNLIIGFLMGNDWLGVNQPNLLACSLISSNLIILGIFIRFKSSNKDLKFEDYIKSGFSFFTLIALYNMYYFVAFFGVDFVDFFDLSDFPGEEDLPLIIYLGGIIWSSLLSVFFPKGTIKEKLGNLVKVVLFVIVIYDLIKPFIGGGDDEDESGIDTDGDGIKDSFDTDGDGKIDTTFVDTDGDGISDTIDQDTDGDGLIDTVSSDTDGDGLIDTVVADTDGDGLTDTIIKDVDIDGDGQSDFRITKGKGLT